MLKAKVLYKTFKYIQSKHQGQLSLTKPMSAQEHLLQNLLQRQASTIYGQRYRFDRIRSIDNFQNQVPLTTMADYEPYFNQLKKGATIITLPPLPS